MLDIKLKRPSFGRRKQPKLNKICIRYVRTLANICIHIRCKPVHMYVCAYACVGCEATILLAGMSLWQRYAYTHTQIHTHSLDVFLSRCLSLFVFLSLSLLLSLSLFASFSLSLSRSLARTRSHALSLSFSCFLSRSHSLSLALSLSCSFTHTQTRSMALLCALSHAPKHTVLSLFLSLSL